MQRRPARACGLQRLGVGSAIDRAEEDLIVEEAHLDDVAQERVAELEPRAGQLARKVRYTERTVQVAADGLLVRKQHPTREQRPSGLPPQLVPAEGKPALVGRAQPEGLVAGSRSGIGARLEVQQVLAVGAQLARRRPPRWPQRRGGSERAAS